VPCSVRYSSAAAAEIRKAIAWYNKPDIGQSPAFVQELERTEAHRRSRPELYQRVEGEIRRAILRRFPYSLFYVIENNLPLVLACMHHHPHQTPPIEKGPSRFAVAGLICSPLGLTTLPCSAGSV
jgi:plasmid stabilization system protein ParE